MPATSTFDWIDTPKPTERAFKITAKEDPSDQIPDFINQRITWATCPGWIKKAETVPVSLQGYTLVHAAKAGFQTRNFFFAKTRTTAERRTPFETTWVTRPFPWPTVLLKLWAEEGVIPVSALAADGEIQSVGGTLFRDRHRPGGSYPTLFRIQHFLSERPFPKKRHLTPIPDSISWEWDGVRGSFPSCLHPGVVVTNQYTTGNVVFGFGTPTKEIGGDLVSQEYPPTDMEDWESHVIEDTRNNVLGTLQHRIVVKAYPPIDDREVKS